nr:MerR family transcriptional regulator [uncultured Sphaerochaeta sp.]
MYTISRLASEFGISRSTLIYYDSIGLLKPHKRSNARYRLYSKEERNKLLQIINFRQMGLPLKEEKKILRQPKGKSKSILRNHLLKLSEEIRILRQQQYAILNILKDDSLLAKSGIINKEPWKSILRSTGLDEPGMSKWHIEFEKSSPQAHNDFLISLGLNKKEIKLIRKESSDNSTI